MSVHKDRSGKRAEHEDPVNFTCGKCGQVHPFNEGYKCTNEDEAKEEE